MATAAEIQMQRLKGRSEKTESVTPVGRTTHIINTSENHVDHYKYLKVLMANIGNYKF